VCVSLSTRRAFEERVDGCFLRVVSAVVSFASVSFSSGVVVVAPFFVRVCSF
tara:strand:- start:534 stop:689 length:156 start_codon:yes stop_codon:yes gene_type:complete